MEAIKYILYRNSSTYEIRLIYLEIYINIKYLIFYILYYIMYILYT